MSTSTRLGRTVLASGIVETWQLAGDKFETKTLVGGSLVARMPTTTIDDSRLAHKRACDNLRAGNVTPTPQSTPQPAAPAAPVVATPATPATPASPLSGLEKIQINPSLILVGEKTSVHGGKRVSRKVEDETNLGTNGRATDAHVRVEIDDVRERKEAESLKAKAYATIRRHSAYSPLFGYLAPASKVATIQAEIASLREQVADFNRTARYSHVDMRIGVARFDVVDPESAKEIARTIVESLVRVRDALNGRDQTEITNALNCARPLPAFGAGPQADAIRFALDESDSIRKAMKEDAGILVQTPMLDSAISMWTV